MKLIGNLVADEYHSHSLFKQQKSHKNSTSMDVEVDAMIEAEFIWMLKKAVRA